VVFRVRRVLDDVLPMDRRAIEQVQAILREHFPGAGKDADELAARLRDPMRFGARSLLFVADDLGATVLGFAQAWHDAKNGFVFLDYIATPRRRIGSGAGGALYERLREEARSLGAQGIYLECAPDVREECASDELFRQNVARLRFYERFGARPVEGTDFRLPMRAGDSGYPFLVFDPLGSPALPRKDAARRAARSILEQKYGQRSSPAYRDQVVRSFRDDPLRLRPTRYVKASDPPLPASRSTDALIPLVVNERHEIHHVRERGYVEAPVRVRAILGSLERCGLFERIEARRFGDSHVTAVHDADFVRYLRRCCEDVPEGRSVYPYVFPIRNVARPPTDLSMRAGYYCIDTFTPLHRNAWAAARGAVDCALTAAASIEGGRHLAYALVRPPGHHAERRSFGGFCYLNSNAIAANYLSRGGRVAILDVDYHHGNGQQQIFWERDDVLTISIHGHPRVAYPYFSGFAEERGEGPGAGFNLNLPLPEAADGKRYRDALEQALARIRRFRPTYLVVALGLDTARSDPTGTWALEGRDFEENGRRIGALRLPTLVVQEGGYRTRTLGANARRFFEGLHEGVFGAPRPATAPLQAKR
jgi:acetoin utilization deacetylase AcuC-like enzyme/predicted N-acetyltransferase YhbS